MYKCYLQNLKLNNDALCLSANSETLLFKATEENNAEIISNLMELGANVLHSLLYKFEKTIAFHDSFKLVFTLKCSKLLIASLMSSFL